MFGCIVCTMYCPRLQTVYVCEPESLPSRCGCVAFYVCPPSLFHASSTLSHSEHLTFIYAHADCLLTGRCRLDNRLIRPCSSVFFFLRLIFIAADICFRNSTSKRAHSPHKHLHMHTHEPTHAHIYMWQTYWLFANAWRQRRPVSCYSSSTSARHTTRC